MHRIKSTQIYAMVRQFQHRVYWPTNNFYTAPFLLYGNIRNCGVLKAQSRLNGKRLLSFFFSCRDNILVLDIFFEALNYETIEQKKAYEVAGLLGANSSPSIVRRVIFGSVRWQVFSRSLLPGDIGGQMGLFIGASILTILELFDYLYEVRLELLHWKKMKNLTSKSPFFTDFVWAVNY